MFLTLAVSLGLILVVCGCVWHGSAPKRGGFMHTVVFWLKAGIPEDAADQIADFYVRKVPSVTGVELVFVGRPAGTSRDVVDNSYTVLSCLLFEDAAAQDAWQVDPVHDEFRESFGPWFESVVVYDTIH